MNLKDKEKIIKRILPMIESQDDFTQGRFIGQIEGMVAANAEAKPQSKYQLRRRRCISRNKKPVLSRNGDRDADKDEKEAS